MLNHNSVDAVPMADADHVSERQHPAETETDISPEEVQLFKTLSRKRDVAPIAYMPRALAASARSRNLRRVLTREQGRALEMIGHAVDYLNDCYLFEGDDDELINIGGSGSQAIQILISLRSQILQSAPTREPRTLRLWNALFHRHTSERPGVVFHRSSDHGSQNKPVSVLPLSSSR
ncbi:MAG: hypothetical protein WCD77_05445 [Acidobacteriaceae bacterium]|jgi:hypothetical protein